MIPALKRLFSTAPDPPRWQTELAQCVDRSRPAVIVFTNAGYLRILRNWLAATQRLRIPNVVVVALDEETHRRMAEQHVPCVLTPQQGELSELWRLRVEVFRFLVDNRIDFVHSDADAVWCRNPFPDWFDAYPQYDLLISPGTMFPNPAFDAWGYVLCCGLFLFRSTRRSRKLLAAVAERVALTGDDQQSLNEILLERGTRWTIRSQSRIPYEQRELSISDDLIAGRSRGLRVGVLPFRQFPRLAPYAAGPYVVHDLTPKDGDEIETRLRALELWHLPAESQTPQTAPLALSHQ